ncbi:MAG: shikimate kinase [Bryobacteraceae bacterium]|jgi:shikimate kinase
MILKLKRTPGIYLVGFMGSGKSTIGRLLAERIGWHFVDLDAEIEAAEKTAIVEIFESRGEGEFRRLERETLRRHVRAIECGRPAVLALGGGTIVQPENHALLEENGVSIWLDCPFETVRRRVGPASHRPLARDPVSFAELYEARREWYARADYRVPIESDDPAVAVEAVLRLPLFK